MQNRCMTRCKVQGAGVMLQSKDCKCNVTKIAKTQAHCCCCKVLLLQSFCSRLLQKTPCSTLYSTLCPISVVTELMTATAENFHAISTQCSHNPCSAVLVLHSCNSQPHARKLRQSLHTAVQSSIFFNQVSVNCARAPMHPETALSLIHI